jgi:uroporphyrinogen III methyltransferase/synthase
MDRLANPALLDLVSPDCEVVWAGKEAGHHHVPQEEIIRLLVERARRGLTVVRLKGGDPFVFGRGGEEAEALAAAGVPWEMVPGVTSALAGPAAAGVPVTHRGVARSVAVVTGHTAGGGARAGGSRSLDPGTDTVVVLMGARNLDEVVSRLVAEGRPAGTPACLIASATTADQRVVSGPLGDVPRLGRGAGITSPAVLVVGEVCALRDRLAWWEDLPLAGRRVVVTRAAHQTAALSRPLERLGADVFPFPAIRVEAPAQGEREARLLDECLERLPHFDWVVFTSVNGVGVFFDRLRSLGYDARRLAGRRVAAVGEGTAARLADRGVAADLVPEEFTSEALVEALALAESAGGAMSTAPLTGRRPRVLLVRSDLARPEVATDLERRGFEVRDVAAYRLRPAVLTPGAAVRRDALRRLLESGRVHALTFLSAATVGYFLDAVGRDWLARAPAAPDVFCIGPVTAERVIREGLPLAAVPEKYTVEALVETMVRFYRERGRSRCST